MSLLRRQDAWDPLREIEEMGTRINRLFGMGRPRGNGEREFLATTEWAPSCDISENGKEYRVRAELPGVKKEKVKVTLENGVLSIQGERREERDEKDEKVHRQELSYGSFLRSFTMPDDADESKVDATFKDGILQVTIGKSKAKAPEARQIAIH